MIDKARKLSLGTLYRTFWLRITVTWVLTLVETALFALIPLLIGRAIDGLLADEWLRFYQLLALFATLIVVAVGRRIYDTRAYGGIRVHLGNAQASRAGDEKVSVVNARVLMGRELVDFMEDTAPESMTALVQVIASIVVLVSFHGHLALAAGGALVFMLAVYGLASRRFYKLNGALNAASENQVHALESKSPKAVAAHFLGLKKQEVKLSDTEAVVYGFIFLGLISMLAFNLWFAATQLTATPGQIFSVVTYSMEFLQSAVMLPFALQSLTRLSEITNRINSDTKPTN